MGKFPQVHPTLPFYMEQHCMKILLTMIARANAALPHTNLMCEHTRSQIYDKAANWL